MLLKLLTLPVTSLTVSRYANRCRGGGTDADRHNFLAVRAAAVTLQRALRIWALHRRVTLAIHLQRLWRGYVLQFNLLKFVELVFFLNTIVNNTVGNVYVLRYAIQWHHVCRCTLIADVYCAALVLRAGIVREHG
jgi:hypothetical protein